MICPNCKNKIKGNFSLYKELKQNKNIINIPMYGNCEYCDIFYTWNTAIDDNYNIEETNLQRFIFC